MQDKPALCIDLGASFTKIAIRTSPNEPSQLLRDYDLMTGAGEVDNQFCFPSATAHNIEKRSWAFGWETTDYQQSENILMLQDWKSVLFHEKYLEEYYDPDIDGDVDPVKIFLQKRDPYFIALACAQNYLKWLHDEQIPRLLSQNPELSDYKLSDFTSKICVPDFVIDTGAEVTIERVMEEAGFDNPDIYCVSEPTSSLIGVLTGGLNYLNDDDSINQAVMFGDVGIVDKLSNQGNSVLFLDIGSFTTDIALADFSHLNSVSLSKSPTASYPLGMYKLDSMIQSSLPEDVVNLNNLPDTEKFHRAVYNESAMNQYSSSDSISLLDGTEIPLEIVSKKIDDFCRAIMSACDLFVSTHNKGTIHTVVLTGGGSLPSRIADRIVIGLEQMQFPLLRAHKNLIAAEIPVETLDDTLVRGASAIGGTSILLAPEDTRPAPIDKKTELLQKAFTSTS